MKKIAVAVLGACSMFAYMTTPAQASTNCLLNYMNALSSCTDSVCVANAGAAYLLCTDTKTAPCDGPTCRDEP